MNVNHNHFRCYPVVNSGLSLFCIRVLAAFALLSFCVSTTRASESDNKRPNIIFILADDLGMHDLGVTGEKWIETPNLDQLRNEGMMFTHAYASAPICSASRASLLTGKSSARVQFEFVTKWDHQVRQLGDYALRTPPFPKNLPDHIDTVGTVLSNACYNTAFMGKWHLNTHFKHYLGWSPTHGPGSYGFQYTIDDFGSHPYGYSDDDYVMMDLTEGTYLDDALVSSAVDYIQAEHKKPYLLWMCFYYVHDPYHSKVEWLVEKYRKLMPAGTSEERIHYAAMVETMDQHVGRILDAVEDKENTMIVFMSDNGGAPLVSANGPLRGSKWNLYQGGVRVPLIVSWPGKVEKGSTCDVPVIGSDILPTLADCSGANVRTIDSLDGKSFYPLLKGADWDGENRVFVWHFPYYHPETDRDTAKATIGINDFVKYHRVSPHSAILYGKYALLWFAEADRFELYNLDKDPSQLNDISTENPSLVKDMKTKLFDYLDDVNARYATRP